MPDRAVVFDFDGVICNSQTEVLFVGGQAYTNLSSGSRLLDSETGMPVEERLRDDFFHLLPLGNRAEDFGAAFLALETGAVITNQEDYDDFFGSLDAAWLDAYHRGFYRCRSALRNGDPDAWLSLHRPYVEMVDILRRPHDRYHLAIATAKDAGSVTLLLEEFGLEQVFPRHRILDKETGRSKRHHLSNLSENLSIPLADMTFIDDKLRHLQDVACLGVRGVLAGWGYNGEREHTDAEKLGFAVAHLQDAEQILFAKEG